MLPTERVRIGNTGVTVTRMGLGGAPLAALRTKAADKAAAGAVAAAWEAGLRYFDTAPRYGKGLSEQRLGEALSGLPRDELTISTKVGFLLDPAKPARTGRADVDVICDFSRDGVLRSLEESCARLRTDRVDIALIHDPDWAPDDPEGDPGRATGDHFREVMEGAYPALEELRAAGTVGAVGLGMNQWPMLLEFARAGDFDCFMLAGRYTLLDQTALPELLPECAERGISVIMASVFNSGILATGPGGDATFNYAPAPVEIKERARGLEAVCTRHGVALTAAALQFPLAHPAVAAAAVGARDAAELHADLAHAAAEMPPALWREIGQRELIDPAAPTP
ncbi:MAG: aldo/keto reductase [Spirochaetaceae bacterium]|nr:aldo/keto reductase [Spirochaetaceae bacterium]